MVSLERYNDLSGPIIDVEFSDKLNHYQPFKKDSFEVDTCSRDIIIITIIAVVVWPWGRLSL
jgi:hypothetical protein